MSSRTLHHIFLAIGIFVFLTAADGAFFLVNNIAEAKSSDFKISDYLQPQILPSADTLFADIELANYLNSNETELADFAENIKKLRQNFYSFFFRKSPVKAPLKPQEPKAGVSKFTPQLPIITAKEEKPKEVVIIEKHFIERQIPVTQIVPQTPQESSSEISRLEAALDAFKKQQEITNKGLQNMVSSTNRITSLPPNITLNAPTISGTISGVTDDSVPNDITIDSTRSIKTSGTFESTATSATSSFIGGVTTSGLFSSNGISITGGSIINTSGATSTFTSGISAGGLSSGGGITLTGGSILSSSTATSTLSGGVNLTAGCFSVNGSCVGGGTGSGVTDNGTTVTLTTNSDLLSVGTGTPSAKLTIWSDQSATNKALEVVNNSSSTLFTVLDMGNVGVGTTSPGTKFAVQGAAVITGTTTVQSIVATSGIEASYITVTTSGTSSFTGGASTAGLSSSNGIAISGGSLLNTSAATSTFSAGISTAYLNSTGNLNVAQIATTFGLVATNATTTNSTTTNLAVTSNSSSTFVGPIVAAGLASSNGITISGGSLLNTSAATSTFSSGISAAYLNSTANANVSGSLTTSGFVATNSTTTNATTTNLAVTGNATSSFTGAVSTAGISSSNGLTLTGGSILSTSAATSALANGFNLTSGCFAISGTCVGGGGGGGFTDNGATVVLTTSTDLLSLGTTTPSAKLTVWSDGATSNKALEVANNSSTTLLTVLNTGSIGIGSSSPQAALSIHAPAGTSSIMIGSSTTYFLIDKTGKVGVNTLNPNSRVEITQAVTHSFPTPGTTFGSLTISPTGTDDDSASITFRGNQSGSLVAGAQAGIYVQSSNSYGSKMYLGTASSYATGAQVRLTIDHVGNIGIGTEAPANLLHLSKSGGASVTSAITNAFVRLKDTNAAGGARFGIVWEQADATNAIAAIEPSSVAGWDTHLNFMTRTDGALFTSLHLDENGSVGIASTSPTLLGSANTGLAVQGSLYVSGTTSVHALVATSTLEGGRLSVTTSATSSFTGGLTALTVGVTGGLSISGGSITSVSSASSTFGNGINLTAGCFAINGTCVSSGGGGGGFTDNGTTVVLTTDSDLLSLGTSTPSAKLTVWSDGATSNKALEVANRSSTTLLTVLNTGSIGIGSSSPQGILSINATAGTSSIMVGSSSTYFLIDKNGRVGINTLVPNSRTEITQAVTHSFPTPGTTFGSLTLSPTGTDDDSASITFRANQAGALATGAQAGIYVQSSNSYGSKMYFGTASSYGTGAQIRLAIDHVGNIGIGTEAPANLLHLSKSGGTSVTTAITNAFVRFKDTNTDGGPRLGIVWEQADATNAIAAIEPSAVGGWDTHLNFFTRSNGILYNSLHLDENGSVGIGTTTPTLLGTTTAGLAISGGLYVHGSTSVPELHLSSRGLADMGSSTPKKNTLYRENLIKGWVSFDGTGTVRIRDSFNVSSITDNGTGQFTVNWLNAFADTNYATVITLGQTAGGASGCIGFAIPNTSVAVGSVSLNTVDSADALADCVLNYVVAIGDQN